MTISIWAVNRGKDSNGFNKVFKSCLSALVDVVAGVPLSRINISYLIRTHFLNRVHMLRRSNLIDAKS